MALKSSYIFLPTRNAVEQSKSTRVFTLIRKISKVLQNEFLFADQCVTYDNNLFKCSIKFSLTLETVNFDVDILINQVVDKIYVDVTINYFSKEENVCYMEYVNEKIVNIGQGLSNDYVLIITYDAVSEYYCNKIYPELNKLERNLRKLLFNIYILNFGQDYYTETIKPEIQNKIKARVKAKGNEGKKEIERIKQFFYSLEYSEIQLILFEEKWTSLDEKKKNDFLIQNSDLAKLEDSYLRKVIEDISPKSDWDRFFANRISDVDVKELIEIIRVSRNNIAHCKFLYKHEYQKCINAITSLSRSIDQAIELTEEIDFAEKNRQHVQLVFKDVQKQMEVFLKNFSSAMVPIVQQTQEISKSITTVLSKIDWKQVEYNQKLIANTMASAFSSLQLQETCNGEDDGIEIALDEDEHDSLNS